ncbi:N-acetylmuramoyl-L-alanine amidase [[Eubacterium] yurii subsp. margaretiae ATCC 43715]|nr:N-acetylmuramoyl-L-alanine amidase [[Eubacterium] yurii subsp. margaretiae ATCC 43715]
MKINKKSILMTAVLVGVIGGGFSYAKLPIEYDNFTIKGKTVKLALADLTIDGATINKKTAGVSPVVINSRTMVPVRALTEKMGYKVSWIDAKKQVTIENQNNKIELVIGKANAKVNGVDKKITDNVSPMVINSSTYVPIRFVVENMGLDINYDAKDNKIMLNTEKGLIFEEKGKVAKAEEVDDPSVPKDVEKFIVKPNQPTAPTEPTAPTIPEKPTVTDTPKVEEPKKKDEIPPPPHLADDSSSGSGTLPNNGKINEISSSFSEKDGDKTFRITQKSGNIDVSYYFLQNPKQLVIDVRNAAVDMYDSVQTNLDGKVFISATSTRNDTANYTRYTIDLGEGVNTNDIKFNIRANVFEVLIEKQYVADEKQKEVFSYSFDRASGAISIKTKESYDITNHSQDQKVIFFVIPKDMIKLNVGRLNVSNRLVKYVEIKESGNDYNITMELSDRVTYNISKTGARTTTITLKKNNRKPPLIVLDPGHGAQDAGAINKQIGITEKALNLQVATKLKTKFENAGYQVMMTRSDDSFVPLNDIAAFSNGNDPDIFISIHHNSSDNTSASGIETFYYASEDSKKLASTIRRHLISRSGAVNRGTKNAGFVVIKKTTSPATLLELGFVSNNAEVRKNMSDSYQNTLTDAIVSAVNEYFNN